MGTEPLIFLGCPDFHEAAKEDLIPADVECCPGCHDEDDIDGGLATSIPPGESYWHALVVADLCCSWYDEEQKWSRSDWAAVVRLARASR